MISKETAAKIMLGLLSVVILFHFSILFGIISYVVVWAGKINSLEQMYVFESISIFINILLIVVLSIKLKNLRKNKINKTVDIIIWIFVVLFALNTIGNLFAKSTIELILGTSLTFISSILCWIMVRKEKSNAI